MKNPFCGAIATALGLLAFGSATFGQGIAPGTAGPAPLIGYDANEINLGKVNSGAAITHTFIITNTGAAPLIISNVHPSCHCTLAAPWTREIAPGQTGSVPIQFNSTGFSGQIHRTVDVVSNAKDRSHAILRFTVSVWKAIDITPSRVFLTVPSSATNPVNSTVRIVNETESPLTISNVVSSDNQFGAQLNVIKPGKEFQLVISALPPFEMGSASATITMNTSLSTLSKIEVPINAYMPASIQVQPPRVNLHPLANRWTTNTVMIFNSDYPGFVLSDPECSDPQIKLSLQQINPQRPMFNLRVAAPPNYQLPAGKTVEITVKSNHPRHPVIRIPVAQVPQNRAFWSNPGTAQRPHP